MVSSGRVISCCWIITISGLAVVSRISEGMVEGGLSVALRLGKSAISLASGCRMVLMPLTKIFKALLCLQVYLLQSKQSVNLQMAGIIGYTRGVGQLNRIQWVVEKLWSQRGHFESTLILHLFRLSGVGRVSEPAFRRNESWPAGRPASTTCSWLPAQ